MFNINDKAYVDQILSSVHSYTMALGDGQFLIDATMRTRSSCISGFSSYTLPSWLEL